ncbi:O-antigen ligase family protein [Roseateles paludis]|uniref:O-antigen ligase family protein n=1 Tax=Roseateles paludis TaxID=3145238 RepID=A0ABV0G6M9_9BURK
MSKESRKGALKMELIYWAFQALPFVVAFLAAVALLLIFNFSFRRFEFGLGVLAVTFWLDAATQSAPVLQLGLRWYIADLPLIILGAVTLLRWLVSKQMPWRHPGWLLYVGVFLVNLAIGLATQGTAAGVQARGEFYAIVAASYAMSFPIAREQVRALVAAFAWLGVGLALLTVYRWVVFYAPITDLLPPEGVYNIDGAIRVIGAPQALVLAQALLIGLYFAHLGGAATALRLLSPLFLGFVVALQHRSVWLAAAVGVAVGLLLARAKHVPVWQQVGVVCVMFSLLVGGVMYGGRVGQDVASSAQRAVAGEGTVQARLNNWRSTLGDWYGEGPRAILIGRTLGSDMTRVVRDAGGRDISIAYGAHNNYVTQLVSFGVLGFAGLLWALLSAVRGLWRMCQRREIGVSEYAALLLMLIVVQLAYYVAYASSFIQLSLIGMALAACAPSRRDGKVAAARPVYVPRVA